MRADEETERLLDRDSRRLAGLRQEGQDQLCSEGAIIILYTLPPFILSFFLDFKVKADLNVLYKRLEEVDESETEALAIDLEATYTKLQEGRPSSLIRHATASRKKLVHLVNLATER